jgi:quinol monooxygenase YgiN
MIMLRILMNVLPEKQLEFKQTLLSMIGPTENENGCLRFAAFCDIENQNRFNLIGEWKTRQDLDNHIRSYRFGVLLGSKSLLNEPIRLQILVASPNGIMETVYSLRKKKS